MSKTFEKLLEIQAERNRHAIQELLGHSEETRKKIRADTDMIVGRLYPGVTFENGFVKDLLAFIDTIDGIAAFTTSYESLHELIDLRHVAYYNHGIKLREFVVLGRLRMDVCGNTMPITNPPSHSWADGYPVQTMEQAYLRMQQAGVEPSMTSVMSAIPDAKIRCACCGKTWGLSDFLDYTSFQQGATINAREYIGRTLKEVQDIIHKRTDAIYFNGEYPIRNDKYIDLSPRPDYKTLKVNERGYMRRIMRGHDGKLHGDIAPTHIIEAGDEVHFQTLVFKHKECRKQELRASSRAEFDKAFADAQFKIESVEEIPNEYGSESYRGPWYVYNTQLGAIKIGWRKRVIELDWRSTGQNYLHLFEDVNDTKDEHLIHAYTLESLTDYLKRINGVSERLDAYTLAQTQAVVDGL